MKLDRTFLVALAILTAWLPLAWFCGVWFDIQPPALWYLRSGLLILGIILFGGFLFFRPQERDAPLSRPAARAAREMDYIFAKASSRIQSASGGSERLSNLPAMFLFGDVGSAKTTILAESAIEPELLAGQSLQNNVLIPTLSVNVWHARDTLFIDPSGNVMTDPYARRKLFKKFSRRPLKSLLTLSPRPRRSVLLAVDCEAFLEIGGASAVAAKARGYQSVLSELSLALGTTLPVYVLFTKADKIPYFREFVQNLNASEAAERMGTSLPLAPADLSGSYAEKQWQRLDYAFQTLYFSLADKRPLYLARERMAGSLPGIYEFPREFAKLRSLLVQFLTDLCRPSQARANLVLGGFYFAGLREPRSLPAVGGRQEGARKIPQWAFLPDLLPGVLQADLIGAAAMQANAHVNFVRRAAPAVTMAFALLMAGWWTIAYINNLNMVHAALNATRALPAAALGSGQIASADALQRLSNVRETLALLNKYQRDGPPLSYRAFLYQGNAIYQPLRQTYYSSFRRLLLQPLQLTLIQTSKDPGDDQTYDRYRSVYDALKAYLITTSHHDKRWNRLVSVLLRNWKKQPPVDVQGEMQAASHFAFYAEDLPDRNPYPEYATPDNTAVETARLFLNRFPLEDRIYWALLDTAGDRLSSIELNRDYPGTEDTVRNRYEVAGYFTKPAFARFQKRLQNLNINLGLEEWVLGPATQQDWDLAKIRDDLQLRYDNDYSDTWSEFLVATREPLPYTGYLQAAAVLERLAGPKSALLQLFCVASENTSVGSKDFARTFQPVQLIAPAGCTGQKMTSAATPYVEGLASLGSALKAIGPSGNQDELATFLAQRAVANALLAESTLTAGFQSDPNDPLATVLTKSASLLKDPIAAVTPTLEGLPGAKISPPPATLVR